MNNTPVITNTLTKVTKYSVCVCVWVGVLLQIMLIRYDNCVFCGGVLSLMSVVY